MTGPLFRCPDHGPATAPTCPECGADADRALSGERRRRLSTFLSGALRHFPGDAGLELDDGGRTDWEALVAAATRKYDWADPEDVAAVAETDPKGRFQRDGGRVRAAYGHSVDVDLEAGDGDVPDRLYHGTAPENVDDILAEGLKPMGRREVYLSESVAEAREVGRRHAPDPVVFAVDAAALVADGYLVAERGEGVYAVDEVPPEHLTPASESGTL